MVVKASQAPCHVRIRVEEEGDHVEDSSIIALLLLLPITFYSCRSKKLFARYAKALGYRKCLAQRMHVWAL